MPVGADLRLPGSRANDDLCRAARVMILTSARRHSNRAIEPDGLAVEHLVLDDVLDQRSVSSGRYCDDFQISLSSSRSCSPVRCGARAVRKLIVSDCRWLSYALRFRRQESSFSNKNEQNTLRKGIEVRAANGECGSGDCCQRPALDVPPPVPEGETIADVWERLSPHIRETILTLIDVDLA